MEYKRNIGVLDNEIDTMSEMVNYEVKTLHIAQEWQWNEFMEEILHPGIENRRIKYRWAWNHEVSQYLR